MKCVRNFTCKPKRPRKRDPILLRKKIGRFITSDLKFTRKDTITQIFYLSREVNHPWNRLVNLDP